MHKSNFPYEKYLAKVRDLERFVRNYGLRNPTIKVAAEEFGVSQKTIRFLADDSDHLDVLVAVKTGVGIGEFNKADQLLEYY